MSCLTSDVGATGSRASRHQSRKPECESNRIPSAYPNECTNSASGREAEIFGSFWRSEPAAALRGFANGRFSAASSSSFRRSNALTGR
jgi:hypothetical protein